MNFGVMALVFGVIFIAELPDKSLFASLILGTRYNAFDVWLGAAAAFGVQVVLAVTAGHFLTLLPHRALEGVMAALFLVGAGMIFFGKHGVEETPQPHLPSPEAHHKLSKVFMTSFSVVFIGEMGDITQIATANYAAKYHDPLSVGIGAVLALWLVTGLVLTLGNKVLSAVPPALLQRITGLVLLAFGIISLAAAIK